MGTKYEDARDAYIIGVGQQELIASRKAGCMQGNRGYGQLSKAILLFLEMLDVSIRVDSASTEKLDGREGGQRRQNGENMWPSP